MALLVEGLSRPSGPLDRAAAVLELNTLRGISCRASDALKSQHLQVCPKLKPLLS